jgi:acyl dehydratase
MTEHAGVAWSDVNENQELPPLTFEVTLATLAKDVAGTRDIYPIHHDPEFARANGARDIFLNTMWYQGFLGRYVTDWGGSNSFVRKLGFDMRGTCCPGDTLTVHGTVLGTTEMDDKKLVDLDVRIDTQHQSDAITAKLTLELT